MRYLIALLTLLALPAAASPDAARISLLPGWRAPDGTVMVALRVQLAPGWKTYWRAPGETGIPPQLDWSGSENLETVQIHWPTPERLHSDGMRVLAYHGDVVIPITLHPETTGPLQIDLNLYLGLCKDICMPVEHHIQTTIDPGTRRNPAIVAALLSQPQQATGLRCTITPNANGLILTAHAPHPPAEAVLETPGADWISEPEVTATPDGLSARATVAGQALVIDRSQVRLTLFPEDAPALEYIGCE